jgi:Protein of unknown function (DUF3455)
MNIKHPLVPAAFFFALIIPFALADNYSYESTADQIAPTVPAELRLEDGYRLVRKLLADGVQIYTCKTKADNSGSEWVFKAPEATLSDEAGTKVGTHGAGPFWAALDGSRVTGEVKVKLNSSDPNAIPWLLLATKSVGTEGLVAKTAYIQRLDTVGGKAPSDGCVKDTLEREVRVPYTANYYFYEAAK